MITRIEINGFKSFHQFGVNLRPFQVFIGPNGVGKTNLFDAIVLLSHLAGETTVEDALNQSRGEIAEQFTMYPDGTRAKLLSFAVEMLIGRSVTEPEGKTLTASSTRLRYELDLESKIEDGIEHVYVARESLLPITEAADTWVKDHIATKFRKNWIVREKRPPFITTAEDKGQMTIFRNQDAPGGGREAFSVGTLNRTVLSSSNPLRYPTAYAAQQEMSNWRFLQLNPPSVRTPIVTQTSAALMPDGSNLANVLARMSAADSNVLTNVVRELTGFIPDLKNLSVKPIPGRDGNSIEIETQEGLKFSSRVLSDGTLRLLSLVTLKNDPQHRGVLCFEEPENGVQPQRLKQIVEVLLALSTTLGDQGTDRGLRQVLINTHSPGLLASVPADSLFYVGMKTQDKRRETHIVPVRPLLIGDADEQYYTWEQVKQYLDTMPTGKNELGF